MTGSSLSARASIELLRTANQSLGIARLYFIIEIDGFVRVSPAALASDWPRDCKWLLPVCDRPTPALTSAGPPPSLDWPAGQKARLAIFEPFLDIFGR